MRTVCRHIRRNPKRPRMRILPRHHAGYNITPSQRGAHKKPNAMQRLHTKNTNPHTLSISMKAKHIISILILLALLTAPVAAAGGSGTASSPYLIATATELQSINNNLGAYYRLTADIDLAGRTWTPIGTTTTGFFGELDGDGHIIKNLALSRTDQSAGLFRTLTSGATIKDLTLQDCSVTSTSSWCGVLAGSIIMSSNAHETATISNVNCVRSSASSSSDIVANLVGLIYTAAVVDIADCDISASNAESTSSAGVANLVGYCSGGSSTQILRCTVANSHAKASSANVANLVGVCNGGSSVSAENCDVNNCIAKGTNYVGGLVGLVDKDYTNNVGSNVAATNCNINDCTIVSTSNYAGGIAGRIITTCTGIFSGCTVSGCTILANTYAAGICPAYA